MTNKQIASAIWKIISHPRCKKAYIYTITVWLVLTTALNGLAFIGRGAEWMIETVPFVPAVYAEPEIEEEMPFTKLDPSMVDESTYPDPTILVIHDTDIPLSIAKQKESVNRSHKDRGYNQSHYSGLNIAYHYFIGTDGTLVQIRSDGERTEHTACGLTLHNCTGEEQEVNEKSIAIVVAGSFNCVDPKDACDKPTREQMKTLKKLINKLDKKYHFEKIIPHMAASPTACPGTHMIQALKDVWRGFTAPEQLSFNITRYYTPTPGQPKYFRNTYEEDFKVNCSGDCLVTASGYRLKEEDAFKVAACPPQYKFGQKILLDVYGVVTCQDRGSAIQTNRLDLWAGLSTQGLENLKIHTCPNATKDGCPLTGILL